jgi:hypothetical protein
LIGVAVKVIEVPWHTLEPDVEIETDGVDELVVIVTGLLITVATEIQEELLVITTVTTSLLFSVDEVKVLPVEATFTPFTLH